MGRPADASYGSSNSSEVMHKTVNGKYRMVIERSAVKGIDGFKVEANDDCMADVLEQAQYLYDRAKELTEVNDG